MSFELLSYGDPKANTILVQLVDDHDLDVIENEIALVRDLSGGQTFCLQAVKVQSWNHDLSPWPASPVFGTEAFGDGAPETLQFLLEEVLPQFTVPQSPGESRQPGRKLYLGGYSLAGLFALWAGCQTDRFDGIAAASPSVWFPGFTDYLRTNRSRAGAVYLSLGDREERTRNPVMARVGGAIREAEMILQEEGTNCILEWNKGNHFKDPDRRMAKGFAWVMGAGLG